MAGAGTGQPLFRNAQSVTKIPQSGRQQPRGRPRLYPTNAARQASYRRRQRTPVYHRSTSVEWETPADLFAQLDAEFHFTLDVAASVTNAKCARYYTRAQDALQQPWEGICWCNPPYGPGDPAVHGQSGPERPGGRYRRLSGPRPDRHALVA